jgi:hypothetical protein
MMAWSRSARVRSGSGISAILASTSLSPSAFLVPGRRASAFSSRARSFIAARSSSVNPPDSPPVLLPASFRVPDFGLIETSSHPGVGNLARPAVTAGPAASRDDHAMPPRARLRS